MAGDDIVISRSGKPLVHLTPYLETAPAKPARHGGQWTHKIHYAPDYDKADAAIEKLFERSYNLFDGV